MSFIRHDNLFTIPVTDGGGGAGIDFGHAAGEDSEWSPYRRKIQSALRKIIRPEIGVLENFLQAKPSPTRRARTSHCSFDRSNATVEETKPARQLALTDIW